MFKNAVFVWMLLAALAMPALAADLRQLTVDRAHSRVDVSVHATVDSFVGKLTGYEALLLADPVSGQIGRAEFRFQFADLKTGKAARDDKMLAWEESAKYPGASFVLRELRPREAGQFEAVGTLQLHGVQKELSFPVAISTDRKTYAIDGEVRIDTREFNLPIIRMALVLKVDPVVTVSFHLQANAP